MRLQFADGSVFTLVAGSIAAKAIIAQLSTVMQLGSEDGSARSLVLITPDMFVHDRLKQANTVIPLPASCANTPHTPLICRLLVDEKETSSFPPYISATRIVHDIIRQKGLLLHGALAEGPCGGVILTGPGGTGKSTASRRLSPPWHSLSDDATLVVRDAQGQYWAHPWPTWSQFLGGEFVDFGNKLGGSWNVQYAVPLRGIFFLKQATDDRATTLLPERTVMSLIEAAQQMETGVYNQPKTTVRTFFEDRLTAAQALAETVPAYSLHISLTGMFWEEIERVLPVDHTSPKHPVQTKMVAVSPPVVSQANLQSDDPVTYAVTIGSSMAPTLCEPDILTIEPYREQPVRRGDVVCFQLPECENMLVQRVTRITAEGIHTRSDNTEHTERHCLKVTQIVGRVVATQRDRQQQQIVGGWRGQMTGYALRLRQITLRAVAGLWDRRYDILAKKGIFYHIVPLHLKPRVFIFQDSQIKQYKIMMGKRMVGYTDLYPQRFPSHTLSIKWHIQAPFHLFIDGNKLP